MALMTIAALQLDLKANDNLGQVVAKIKNTVARYPQVHMILLSELAICGPGASSATPRLNDCLDTLCNLAKSLDIWLIPGSIYEDKEGKVFNSSPVINTKGEVVAHYSKMYPFYPFEKGVAEGQNICVFEVPGYGKLGISICYDMWFPELSRAMISEGAEVILHPTLTDSCDRDVELAMVQATAAQQQCYVVDVNGAGKQAFGKSRICGPDGDIIYQSSSHEEVMLVELDFERVRRSRERGLMGLGQPLKSFRDAGHKFPHEGLANRETYLDSLGALELPIRTSV
jgi:predicted amidohydrolase